MDTARHKEINVQDRTKGKAFLKAKLGHCLDNDQLESLEQAINKVVEGNHCTYDHYLRNCWLHIDSDSPVQNKTLLPRLQKEYSVLMSAQEHLNLLQIELIQIIDAKPSGYKTRMSELKEMIANIEQEIDKNRYYSMVNDVVTTTPVLW